MMALVLVFAGCAAALPGDGDGPTIQNTAPTEHQTTDTTITVDSDIEIAITIFQPKGSSATDPVPVILHSHGWSGSRTTEIGGFVETLLDKDYGVVSIDMRGHGDSGGEAHVHGMNHEIEDVRAVIDHIFDNLDWAQTEATTTGIAKDVKLGAIGGSYGGGYQLLTAAVDERLDALAPEITWNDLPYALAPNGAIKSGWVDLLYAGGTTQATLAPFIHESYWWAMSTNELPDGDLPGEPDAMTPFTSSSPMTYPDAIDVPALIIQGVPDTLFNLNQAVANVNQIRSTDAAPEVKLLTHLGGHIINTAGTLPGDSPFEMGLQPAAADGGCTDVDTARLAWFDEHLKGLDDDGLPLVSMALEDGMCADSDTTAGLEDVVLAEPTTHPAYPLTGSVVVPQAAPVVSGYAGIAGFPGDVPSPLRVEILSGQDRLIAGIPHLTGTLTATGPATVYFGLSVEDGATGETHLVDSQTTPYRVDAPTTGTSFALDLAGVATQLDTDDTLYLQVSSTDTQYAHNQERVPGAVVLDGLTVHLPTVAGP